MQAIWAEKLGEGSIPIRKFGVRRDEF